MYEFECELGDLELNLEKDWQALEPMLAALMRTKQLAKFVRPDPVKCAAKTRRGMPCKVYAMSNGRCRLHGGLSTGPKTIAGRAKALANLKQYKKGIRSKL